MKRLKGCFLYPKGGLRGVFLYPKSNFFPSPHPSFLAWAKSVGCRIMETPMGFGEMKKPIPKRCAFLLLESPYCLPYAKEYKNANPGCKVVQIIADTTFLPVKLWLARRLYYWLYMGCVDAFIVQSQRIRSDALIYGIRKPIYVLRSSIANKCEPKRNKMYNNNMLFVGNSVREKGSIEAANAMRYLYGDKTGKGRFELFLVGSCCDNIHPERSSNIVAYGKVSSLKEYFDKCTYYLHPSDFDPCPSSVWEAMYAGLLPIITQDVGQSELFDGELSVLVLDSNEPKVIADKVREIDALSKNKKHRLQRLCMKLVSNYTKEKSLREFKKVFADVFE